MKLSLKLPAWPVYAAILTTLIVAGTGAIATAADGPPDGSNQAAHESGPKDAAGGADKAKVDDKSLREQEVYIPYDKLRKVFEKEGRGVFLPYEKFQELWKAAHANAHPANDPHPPVGAVITEIESEATVEKDVVHVAAKLKIDLLKEGWQEVPLRLGDSALVKATIGGKTARILQLTSGEHQLLIEHKGKNAEQIELDLEYARSITRTPGLNSVSFDAPQAPVSRWKVRIPQSGVKVTMRPLLAATEAPAAKSDDKSATKENANKEGANKESASKEEARANETVLLAFVGAAPSVAIEWTPKAEGASGLAALATAEVDQRIRLAEGVVHVNVAARYTISRAELGELALEVPAEYKVTGVVDANVRQWSVEPSAADAKTQHITIQLFEPAKSMQSLALDMEKTGAFKHDEPVTMPVVKALNVGRQDGDIIIAVDEGLRAEAAHTSGVVQESRVSTANANGFRYRYNSVPYELQFNIDSVQPRITVDSLVQATLEPERLTIDTTLKYNIERAGVFKLELTVPDGFDVRRVQGVEHPTQIAGKPDVYHAIDVDSYHVDGDKGHRRLVVNLAKKAMGLVTLSVGLQRDLREPNLMTPTADSADIAVPWAEVAAGAAQHFSGRVIVYTPESLRVSPSKLEGIRTVSFEEASNDFPKVDKSEVNSSCTAVLAFTFNQEPAELRLAAQRRKPQTTVRQEIVARVDEGVIKYRSTLYYNVLYSAIKSLRIDVPKEISDDVRAVTPGIRETVIAPQPADVTPNCVAWSLTAGKDLIGDGQIDLVWERKIDKVEVGKAITVNVPGLVPRDVYRAWGQIALTKSEMLDFREGENVQGLRGIDPQQNLLPPVEGATRAFEFQGDWSLPVTVLRYGLDEVPRTSVDRAIARAAITQAGQVAVQAVYRVRSMLPHLAIDLPDNAKLDSDAIRVNGVLQAPLKGDKPSRILIPLAAAAETPVVLEVRYTLSNDHELALPQFPEKTAIQKVYLYALTPAKDDLIAKTGAWSEEFQWHLTGGRWMPAPTYNGKDANELLSWTCEAMPAALATAQTFQVDGIGYMFSALRPTADQPLKLVRVDHFWFDILFMIAIFVFGLLLLPLGWISRLIVVGLLYIAFVLVGLFLPNLSVHLCNDNFAIAVICVIVLWFVVGLMRSRRFLEQAAGSTAARFTTRPTAKKSGPSIVKPPMGTSETAGTSTTSAPLKPDTPASQTQPSQTAPSQTPPITSASPPADMPIDTPTAKPTDRPSTPGSEGETHHG